MLVEKVVKIEGMSCMGCAKSVENALKSLEGVERVEVSLEEGSAKVTYDDEKISIEEISEKIEKIGYRFAGVIE